MNVSGESIPNATIEAVARSLFRETAQYGFRQVDYLRFVNILLDLSMKNGYQASIPKGAPVVYSMDVEVNFPLIGKNVRIRPFIKDQDIPTLKRWLAMQEHQHFLIHWPTATKIEAGTFLTDETNVLGMITLNNEEDFVIGVAGFLGYDMLLRKAELRGLIAVPEYRGRGFLQEALKLWMQYGVAGMKLKKIYLNSIDMNIRTIKMNEELGFKVEGILRQECCFDGQYYDVLRMSYIAE
ncbi:MAG: GNAT family N-acetyltransferase [candidate division KSB1 bacterium]|nr:GNAT family N-acetyltransferase [candidate division KSB1 bacterium]MDZ7335184.1 GNAT family N-acetyltransferase [candidate division KSB1 bacterium]MDZ7356529.1 GNAT family N-acetyltransferase [candidate division KSB1 bacterium]MDZ7375341.1 GNAT family N-acetyltransferase [candidate division KSB1 bacterium]MDZ7400726.1 GNAT family N-acetyltransferase [candidate division KSB1 bacterium]